MTPPSPIAGSIVESPGASLVLAGAVEVIAVPRPFYTRRIIFSVPCGATVEDLVRQAGIPEGMSARVMIEHKGQVYGPILPHQWTRIRPRAGRRIIIRAVAGEMGDEGSDDNKTTRMIIQVVLIIVAIVIIYFIPPAAPFVMLALSAAFIAVNMLLPPQPPKLGKLANLNNASSRAPESPTLSISGSQNKANPYGPVPKIYGRHQVFMPAREAVPA